MKMSRLFLSIVLLTAPLFAFAQEAASDARFADLRASMTAEEFKAAGLDKLNDAELSALSAWLNRKVGSETARAVEQVRQKMLAQHDQASKRRMQAMVDAARVLTPEQRKQLAERMSQRRDMMERHQHERRALEAPKS